ncbi:MAG: hypothetical protein N3G21_02430 [Candidatus Hydrogenedentes bacterium]|nr:hypothetical protein [Candidatus Hydrogenedentota bacterium]
MSKINFSTLSLVRVLEGIFSNIGSGEGGKGIKLNIREIPKGNLVSGIVPESFVLSLDGRRYGYAAVRGGKWFIIIDGVESKEYDGILAPGVVFSPDSRGYAYVAMRGGIFLGKQLAVIDGVEGKEYDGFLKGSKFVFDSPNKIHTLALREGEIFLLEIEIVDNSTR